MTRPIVVCDDANPSTIIGLHGGVGATEWKGFMPAISMSACCESFATLRVTPGAAIGEHRHGEAEEVYFVVSGTGIVTQDGTAVEVVPGDLVMTKAGQPHGIANNDDEDLHLVVVRATPRTHSDEHGGRAT